MTKDIAGVREMAPSFSKFWLLWSAASLPAFMLGTWLSFLTINLFPNTLVRTALFALIGAAVGGLQALLLRRRVPELLWWVLVSAGGWALGFSFADRWGVYAGLAIGASLGLLQWMTLSMSLQRALWWFPASLLGWGLGWFAAWQVDDSLSTFFYLLYLLIIALVPALIGGGVMAWLLQGERKPEAQ